MSSSNVAFFDKLTDFYITIFDKAIQTFPYIDAFFIHDDWGSQKETFVSPELAEKMIVPYMRRLTDFLHSKGKFCELHSCGNNYKQVPNYIKAASHRRKAADSSSSSMPN